MLYILLLSVEKQDRAGKKVAQLMRTPSLIKNERLRHEVGACCSEDMDYSPYLDRVRRGIGAEHEFVLQQKLRARQALTAVSTQPPVLWLS